MSDLVERLREHHQMDLDCGDVEELIFGEAADEIERLTKFVEELYMARADDVAASNKWRELAADEIERLQRENEELRKAEILLAVRTEELAALKAQSAEQEPVAAVEVTEYGLSFECFAELPFGRYELFTTPPAATTLVEAFKLKLVKVWYQQGLDIRGAELGKFLEAIEAIPTDEVMK